MGKKVDSKVKDAEADNLKRLLGSRSRADLAREAGPPLSKALISQHENSQTSISLGAARAYARALGVSLRDISPRWADEVADGVSSGTLHVAEHGVAPLPAPPSIDSLLRSLGERLMRAPPKTREAVASLLSTYASDPSEGERIAKAISTLLENDP